MNAKTRFETKQKSTPQVSPLMKSLVGGAGASQRYEGHEIPMVLQARQGNVVTVGLNFQDAPTPTRKYVADTCDVIARKGDIVLVFGQESAYEFALDSVLQLRMGALAAQGFLQLVQGSWTGLPEAKNWEELLQAMNLSKEELTPVTSRPSQEAKIVATYAGVAISGADTCIDFYYSSAFVLQQMAKTQKMFAEPMVRIDLHTALFISLIEKMKSLLSNFPVQKQED